MDKMKFLGLLRRIYYGVPEVALTETKKSFDKGRRLLLILATVLIVIPVLVSLICTVASIVVGDAMPIRMAMLSLLRLTLALAGGSRTAAQDPHLQANLDHLRQMLSGFTPGQLNALALFEWFWLLDILVGVGAFLWYALLRPMLDSFREFKGSFRA